MKTKLLELIDFKKVNTLLEGFNKTTGFVTAILDLEGNVLSKSGWRQICTEFHRIHPETEGKCRISDTELANKMGEGEKYHFYKCLNGLVDVAVPLVINNEHIANLFSGQFFFEKPDKSYFQKQAEKYGFDEKIYLEALDKVPVVSEENVKTSMDFLLNMTHLISEITLQKLEQTELNNELEQKEDRLSKIMLAANDGMWDWDLRTNQVYFDPRYFQMSGYDVDEFPHHLDEFQKRVHPDDVDYVMNEAEKHLKGEIDRFSVKFRFREKSGDWQWIHGKGKIVEWDEKGVPQRFIGTHRDISELKQVEEELRANYGLLHIAEETARFGGWSVDLEKKSCTWSDAVADIHEMPHGYAPPLQDGINFYAPRWKEKITQVFTDCATKGIPYDEEMEIITSNGITVWVRTIGRALKDEKGKIIKVHGSFQDITDQKQTEEALRESEEKMRGIYRVAPAGIGVVSNRVLKDVNPRICEMTGYTRDELIDKNARILYPSQEEYEFVGREKYDQIREKGAGRVETCWKKKDGTIINILLASAPIDQNDFSRGTIFTALDITQRKQAEEALRKSESIKNKMVSNIGDVIVIIGQNEVNQYKSPNITNLFGWKPEELVGKSAWDIVHPDDLESGQKFFRSLLNKPNASGTTELRYQRKDGKYVWIEIKLINLLHDKDIQGILGNYHDISERKKAEEALRQSEEMMRNSQSVAHICSYSTNLDENEIEKSAWVCSPEFYNIFGIDETFPHTIAGWAGFIHPDYREEIVAYHEYVVKNKIPFSRDYKIVRIDDGAERWVHGTGELEFDAKGNPVRMHGAIQDITDRKRAEEALISRENLLNKVFEILPIGLWFADKDGKLIRGNPAGVKIWGAEPNVSIEEYGVFKARYLISGKEIEPDDWALAHTIREGITIVDELLEIDTFDGQKKIILNYTAPVLDDDGNIQGAIVVNQDITKIKRAEEAMRQSEAQFRSVFEIASLGIAQVDPTNGKIILINTYYETITGYRIDELLKMTFAELTHPDDREKDWKLFNKAARGEYEYRNEKRYIKKNGTILWVRIHLAFIRDANGKPIRTVAICEDITEYKKAEKALRESEHNFKELYDDAPVCYHEIDNEGRIIRVNKTETALLGYSQEEMIGKHFWEFLVKDQREMSKKAITEKISAKKVLEGFERDIVCKEGGILTFFIRDSLVLDPNGKATGIRSTLENITERKRAEMLKQMQYKIANAVITSKNLNDLFDSIKNELNSIIDANNIFIALYNEETEMLFSPLFKDEKDDIREWPAKKSLTGYLIRQNQPLLLRKQEINQLHAEGFIDLIGTTAEVWLGVPLKVEGKMLGAVVVQNYDNPDVYDQSSIEILELVAREVSIFIDWQRSEEKANKLSKAVEQSSVSIMITNREGVIEYVNSFFTKLTGYRFEEVKGKNPNILKSGHQSKAFYKEFWDTILSGNDWEGEFLNKKKSGELYWANAVVTPIVNSDGMITNFISIKEDITERKKMFEELLAAKEKAEESDKLKTAFLNNISHEIRTPLNGILGFGSFLSETDLSPEAKTDMLAIVKKSSDRLMNTVENYMDMALIFSGTMQVYKKEFILKPIFDDVLNKTRQLCDAKQLNFEVVSPPGFLDLTLDSDPELISKTLNLLLDNALKFTEKGSIACGYNLINGFIEFFVKDTGKGIAPQKLNAIFNMFTQEDSSDTRGHEGSGLGLSIASGMVKLLGGTISVQSQPGEGSVFTFTVPYKKMEVAEKMPPAREKNGAAAEKPLVLLAEDEESNYLYVEVVLKLAGCDYLLAKNGVEAVALCKQHPDITLVLMDIKMPVMDGLEATRLIREFRPNLTIIATTAYAQTGDEHRFLASGCDGYLAKPIRKDDLLAVLKKYSS
jgi:PAS domain S-box-containing protein